MASHSVYEIAPDDEDDDIISTPASALLPATAKGKGRESVTADPLLGKIGSPAPGSGSLGERSSRTTTFGGIKTETR
jgi:hypothetical protein